MDKNLNERNKTRSWKRKGPNKIRSFLWKVAHGKLMTNGERHRINMTDDNSCPRCQQGK